MYDKLKREEHLDSMKRYGKGNNRGNSLCSPSYDHNLPKPLYPSIIRKKRILPLGVFFDYLFRNFTLVESKFIDTVQGAGCRVQRIELFKEFFIEFKSCFLSAKKCELRFVDGICTHVLPVFIFYVWQIGEEEY